MYLTISGLGGDFAGFNGTHTLVWTGTDSCYWKVDGLPSGDLIELNYASSTSFYWRVLVGSGIGCNYQWQGSPDACSPTDVYSYLSCSNNFFCPNMCTLSAGATCSVSY
jgi:beta-glucanase (GH16 family)